MAGYRQITLSPALPVQVPVKLAVSPAAPEYPQMQYILNEIRSRSGNTHLSFIGEKSSEDFERYRMMGLNAGTAFIPVDDFLTIKYWSDSLKYNRNYAPGTEVSNDNDTGGIRRTRSTLSRLCREKLLFAVQGDVHRCAPG